MPPDRQPRPNALITGVGRRRSIASAIALGLAADGWNLGLNYHPPYDDRLGYEHGPDDPTLVADECRTLGATVELLPGDLADPATPDRLVAAATTALGPLAGLVMSHCESVDASILDCSLESWDRHFAVNTRATWLLIRAFARNLPERPPARGGITGRIAALTSDHTAYNTAYGASKGALDRIVVAAALELAHRGVRANVINPGGIDTGWMTDEIRAATVAATPAGRLGTAADIADLVRFLFGERGGWVNGQLLYSNGGFRTA